MPPTRQQHLGLRCTQRSALGKARGACPKRGAEPARGAPANSTGTEQHAAGCPARNPGRVPKGLLPPCFHLVFFNHCSYSFSSYPPHQHFPAWILPPPCWLGWPRPKPPVPNAAGTWGRRRSPGSRSSRAGGGGGCSALTPFGQGKVGGVEVGYTQLPLVKSERIRSYANQKIFFSRTGVSG